VNILVLSRQHQLLPFAYRLKREGHDVNGAIYHSGSRARYEDAYTGIMELAFRRRDKDRQRKLQALQELAQEGKIVVLANDRRAMKEFTRAQYLFGRLPAEKHPQGTVRLGAWFSGEEFQAPHLLIVDQTAAPGGLGAQADAALTMLRLPHEALETHFPQVLELRDELKSRGFRGLCQWGLTAQDQGLQLSGDSVYGWPSLHTHAFLSDLEDFGAVLGGAEPVIPQRYTMAVVVSQAPWPLLAHEALKPTEVSKLSNAEMARVFWHDAQADQETRTMQTVGLDGQVAVVRGSGYSFELAQSRALQICHRLQFHNRQFRPDAGGEVRRSLALLESEFGLHFG